MKKLLSIFAIAISFLANSQTVTVGRTSIHIKGEFSECCLKAVLLKEDKKTIVKTWGFFVNAPTQKLVLEGFPKNVSDTPVNYYLSLTKDGDTLVNKEKVVIKRVQTNEFITCRNYNSGTKIEAPFKLNYLIYYPEYYFHDKSIKAPLLLTFHGDGQKGTNALFKLRGTYIPQKIDAGMLPNFIVVSPQSNGSRPSWTNKFWYKELLDSLYSKGIDTSEVYISGYSGGGAGITTYAKNHKVAGVASFSPVLSTTASSTGACVLKDARIWAFHCANDGTINPNITRNFVANVKKCPSTKPVRMSMYPTGGHNPFSQALKTDSVFKFLSGEIQ